MVIVEGIVRLLLVDLLKLFIKEVEEFEYSEESLSFI